MNSSTLEEFLFCWWKKNTVLILWPTSAAELWSQQDERVFFFILGLNDSVAAEDIYPDGIFRLLFVGNFLHWCLSFILPEKKWL